MHDTSTDIFSPKRLLTALLALASLTFGIITYDAERFISKQEKTADAMSDVRSDIKVLVGNVTQLQMSDSKQWAKLNDHEIRLTKDEMRLTMRQ